MAQADGIILGSPVYTANVSANMQALLERASVVTDMNQNENLFTHKVSAVVTAARRGGRNNEKANLSNAGYCIGFYYGRCGNHTAEGAQESASMRPEA